MIVTPKRNLSPASEPWGRRVDQRLDQIEKNAERNQQNTTNAQGAINSTVTKLSEQVGAIAVLTQQLAEQQAQLQAQQTQLSAQQATLQSQQASLQNQQNQMAVQVAQINSVVNAQVTGISFANATPTGGTIAMGPGGTYVVSNITVPEGFSRAYITAVSSMSLSGSGVQALPAIVINGSVGHASRVEAAPGVVSAHGSANYALSLSGLGGGSVISVGLRIVAATGLSSGDAAVSGTVIFLR